MILWVHRKSLPPRILQTSGYSKFGVLLDKQKEFTLDFRSFIGDKSKVHCDDFNDSDVDWDEFWNDSVLNIYRSDICTLPFGATVMTALYRCAISVSVTRWQRT